LQFFSTIAADSVTPGSATGESPEQAPSKQAGRKMPARTKIGNLIGAASLRRYRIQARREVRPGVIELGAVVRQFRGNRRRELDRSGSAHLVDWTPALVSTPLGRC
jgi:hypothetical protein